MQNKNLIRFVESFILLPVMTVSMPLGSLPKNDISAVSPKIVFSQKLNMEAGSSLVFNQAIDQKSRIIKAEGAAIDAYFKFKNMPLEGMGMKMAEEADKNGLDYRLLPAISARESTGGREKCKMVGHNFFGWGSCKIGFKSDEEAIEVVANNLGGNDLDINQHYAGKTTKEILQTYNPPSVVPRYAQQVMKIMNDVGDEIITPLVNA